MHVLVMGSTGAVGSELVRQCLRDRRITKVVALSRKPFRYTHPVLNVLVLEDFEDYSGIAEELKTVSVCFCALGVSQTQENNPERYTKITHDYPLACARELQKQNPNARFLFVSGLGADPSGKSKTLWRRVKGETENDLRELLGDKLTIFRPGYIYPIHKRDKGFILDPLSYPLYWMRNIFPQLATDTVELSKAMIECAFENRNGVVGNREIRKMRK